MLRGTVAFLVLVAFAVLLLGVIAVAVSPSTTIAVITELRARGEKVPSKKDRPERRSVHSN